ncbi:MAG: hypothetical protein HYU88_00395 [Chloroflexi bacterium]|nr:hypothetical protein [Chloroflexota bacterium]MBI4506727.1 hypothetical protein [Chloroflexota bacterium]
MTSGQRTHQEKSFLAHFAQLGNVTRAAEPVGAGRSTVYKWRERDAAFAAAWAVAADEPADRLEEEARRHAAEGVLRKEFTPRGEPIIDPEGTEVHDV